MPPIQPARGRPRKAIGSQLRGVYWTKTVMRLSGLSAAQLEDRYRWYASEGSPRPCLWNKYLKGTVTPKDTLDRRSIIRRVEADFPGTARIFHHAIWTLLNGQVTSMDLVYLVLISLRDPIRSWLILPEEDLSKDGIFWRTAISADELYQKLAELQELDAGAAILALTAESKLCQRRNSYYDGWKAFRLWASRQESPIQDLAQREDPLI